MADLQQTSGGTTFVRTPDERFADLPDWPYAPQYVEVDGLRMAYVDDGPPTGRPVLLIHGEPTWGYLYRRMLPGLVEAGLRCVVPDLIGFGRSDKPTEREAYSYASHVDWLTSFVEQLDLRDVVLFVQDWGGLIGLRVAAEHPDRFNRLVIANTDLPDGGAMGEGFMAWQQASQTMTMDAGALLQRATLARDLTDGEVEAYRAPFPDEQFLAGARQFPLLVPTGPDDPAVPANRAAWEVLERWTEPVLTLWAPDDVVLGRNQGKFLRRIPGTADQPHQTGSPAGHFIQDDVGEDLAAAMVAWLS
ncbi:MAG: haloalkane dehalogenase [Ilumatobacteraceae bacterium]